MEKPYWMYSAEVFYFEGKDGSTILVEWWPWINTWEVYSLDSSTRTLEQLFRS